MNQSLQYAMEHWNMVAPVINRPTNQQDYQTLLSNIEDAINLVDSSRIVDSGNAENSNLVNSNLENSNQNSISGLIEVMANAAYQYESLELESIVGNGVSALKYLIKLHGIKQSELIEIGSQGVVSEILNGKRNLTLRHVKELSKRFNVTANVFIDD